MTLHLASEYHVITCGANKGACEAQFAMTDHFYWARQRDGRTWYCPNGHPRIFTGETTEAKLQRAEVRETALKDQLLAAVQDAEQVRVALLRDRQRFANGVCPCCNRSFENVRRHMTTKHPDYDATRVQQASHVAFRCSCGRAFESLRGLRTHQGHSRRPDWAEPDAPRWRAHLTKV